MPNFQNHSSEPIQIQSNGLYGTSHKPGDVSSQVKDQIINMTIVSAKQAGFSDYETALLL
jgi:hypothetical protein